MRGNAECAGERAARVADWPAMGCRARVAAVVVAAGTADESAAGKLETNGGW